MRSGKRSAIGRTTASCTRSLPVLAVVAALSFIAHDARAQAFAGRVEDLNGDGVSPPVVQNPILRAFDDALRYEALSSPGIVEVGRLDDPPSATLAVPGGLAPNRIAFNDVDRDGDEDLAVIVDEKVYYSINTGGMFSALVLLIPDAGRNEVSRLNTAIATVNSDDRPDVVVAVSDGFPPNPVVNELRVYPGQPGGTFGPPLVLGLPGAFPGAVASERLDADANADIAVATNGGVTIVRSESAGLALVDQSTGASLPPGSPVSQGTISFPEGVFELVLKDFNADGINDLLAAGSTAIYLRAGNGNATFNPTLITLPAEIGFSSVDAADVTDDGLPEVFAVHFNTDRIHVWKATAPLVYAPRSLYDAGHDPVSITARDVNADGHTDLSVLHRADSAIMLGVGKGDGSFFFPQRLGNPNTMTGAAAGDFNGDGFPDVIGAGGSGYMYIHFNAADGTGRLLPTEGPEGDRIGVQVKQIFTLPGPGAVAGDGRDRFVVSYSRSFAWLEYSAGADLGFRAVAGGFANTGIDVSGVAPCDINSDGRPDVVTVFAGTNPCARVYTQDASGNFTIPPINITTTSAGGFDRALAPGAASGLPASWLFFHDLQTGRTEVQEYNGALFAFKAEFQSGAPGVGAALGDIDGDGHADLLVANADSASGVRRVTVQTDLEAASPPAPSFVQTPRYPANIAAGDIDGDGDNDVVVCTAGPAAENQHSLVIPNSGAALDPNGVEFYAAGGQPKRIVLADLNDPLTRGRSELSRPEIITADSDPAGFMFRGTLTVLPNISHLAAQPPACPGDANGDGAVGLGDVALMIQHWSLTEPPVPPYTLGDLTGDGLVTLADLAIVIMHWGTTCP